eukprot:TRINITY_DN6351_c0_g1_i2.p1 TRINITY_DN6351_c0_g1~~TRINITY_DN6351_c0_g1_i2.p1  ORF type:complete len:743 (-),score=204.45 TRINITY_DN6351_c0_g1_i2:223-2451(-)
MLLAAGLGNGKLALANFASDGKIVKEFVPKCSRACNAIAWSSARTELIGVGLNKLRQDCSTLVWDINSSPGAEPEAGQHVSLGARSSSSTPLHSLGNCEGAASIAWVPDSGGSALMVGTTYKWIRMYDLRSGTNPARAVIAHSKQVCGMCFDPLDGNRVASFSEDGCIKVWDMRMINAKTAPSATVQLSSKILQISWCATRAGLLTTLCEGATSIAMWNVASSTPAQLSEQPPGAPAECEPLREPWQEHIEPAGEPFVSFDWHPTIENRMLLLTARDKLRAVLLRLPMALAWSPDGSLVYSCERALQCHRRCSTADIGERMLQYAREGYGLDVSTNLQLVPGQPELGQLWGWVHRTQRLALAGEDRAWHGLNALFTSEAAGQHCDRIQRALRLCGPQYESVQAAERWVAQLVDQGQLERAAMSALFHIGLDTAVHCLQSQQGPDRDRYAMIAVALAGYSQPPAEQNHRWALTCAGLLRSVEHPCLRAMFGFLTAAQGSAYKQVLGEPELELQDRVAFACRFLGAEQLVEYLHTMSTEMVAAGELRGLLLTGASAAGEGMELLQTYVDHTADVQTAALLSAFDAQADEHHKRWMAIYRDLMDQWRLWHPRAKLDIALAALAPPKQLAPQIFAQCFYCQTALTRASVAQAHKAALRLMCCPKCSKPLPKCAVCCLPLVYEARSSSTATNDAMAKAVPPKLASLSWCLKCKHGGHSDHLQQWFQQHNECPVAGCGCKCNLIDRAN